MTETELMQSIKAKYGAAIAAAVAGGASAMPASSVPPSFLAALIANESGGDANARRFEPGVLSALWQVLLGRKAAYGSIGARDLIQFLTGGAAASMVAAQSLPADAFQRLDALATSWGLTQIMGYEVLMLQYSAIFSAVVRGTVSLKDTDLSLRLTIKMLADFAQRWNLSLSTDADRLFDCWNTGRPHAVTADPNYIPQGLARMKIYEALP